MPRKFTPTAVLAFFLLLLQCSMIWTQSRFVTQDGPAHLYNSVMVWNLAAHPESAYSGMYEIQARPVPNWTATVVMALIAKTVGARHAERVMATLLLLLGFFAFHYLACGLTGGEWSPFANLLFQTCFLWRAFYNFQLGMSLMLFVLGFYLRRRERFTVVPAVMLSLLFVALFFTHLIATGLALLSVAMIAVWTLRGRPWRDWARHLSTLLVAAAPALLLIAAYAGPPSGFGYHPDVVQSLLQFPMYTFQISTGFFGRQVIPWVVVALYVVAAIFLRRDERGSPAAALLISAGLCFLLYLFVPDAALGGAEVKARFAWGTFLLGTPATLGVSRLRRLVPAVQWVVGIGVIAALIPAWRVNAAANQAADAYAAAFEAVPRGSSFVRVRFGSPEILPQYGTPPGLPFIPLLHADAEAAVNRGLLDLSDYQALSFVFPMTARASFSQDQRSRLWRMEIANAGVWDDLTELRRTLPVTIDYVGVFAGNGPNSQAFVEKLESSGAQRVSTAGSPIFLRVYRLPRL